MGGTAAEAGKRWRVLFLCTGNSCRSQMAEGFARARWGGKIDAVSAGTKPQGMNRLAVRAMQEVGIDISGGTSKSIEDLGGAFDLVVTVCDAAHGACPVVPGARVVHRGFDDPPRLAEGARSDDEAMPHYRRVRDEIRKFIEALPSLLTGRNEATTNTKGSTMNTTSTDTNTKNAGKACCGPDCCQPAAKVAAAPEVAQDELRQQVREGYAAIAAAGTWAATKTAPAESTSAASACCAPSGGGCCGPTNYTPDQLAAAIGYSTGELAAAPESANMGLSCGNPTALAGLKAGEVVLDLGAGGGFDCFIAGAKVGATGRVIGVDMTPQMVSKARANIAGYTAQTGLDNVEFRLGEIESIPAADASVDVVISNCVLNLSPDQARVWKEMARILRPGGRIAVSDIVLLRALPAAVRTDVEALVGCVAGASLVPLIEKMAKAAGLKDVRVERKGGYVDAMTTWQDPLYQRIVAGLAPGEKVGDFVTSADITAVKAG